MLGSQFWQFWRGFWAKYTLHARQVNRKSDFNKLISENSAVLGKLIVTLDLVFFLNHLNVLAGHTSTTDLVEIAEDFVFDNNWNSLVSYVDS